MNLNCSILGPVHLTSCLQCFLMPPTALRFLRATLSISSVQSLSHVRLFVNPWTAARQASLSITNCQSLFTLMSFESVMPSNHLILRHPLLLPPSIFFSIKVFSNESHQVARVLGASASALFIPINTQD